MARIEATKREDEREEERRRQEEEQDNGTEPYLDQYTQGEI